MIHETQPGSSASSGDTRPSLGNTVGGILAAWNRAARSPAAGAQRIRALALVGKETREFCWRQEAVIHRLFANGESHPATSSELELLSRAISYGWFLVYRQEAHGQEALVLHQVGVRVPALPLRPGDVLRLLQEHAPPTFPQPGTHAEEPGQAEREGGNLSVPQDLSQRHHSAATTTRDDRSDGDRPPLGGLRLMALSGLAGEIALFLGLLLTRKAMFGVGMMALFALLLLLGRRLTRRGDRIGEKPRRNQTPTASR